MSEIRWREWGEEAFLEARELDRPILLDIGAVWCHWCHVMDRGIPGDPIHTGTYSNPAIIEVINRDYIPIKVDNDRRPDINARYNMGGWPTTAFLTPEGAPLYGATYLTPDQMAEILENIAPYYKDHKSEIKLKLDERAAKSANTSMPGSELPTVDVLLHVASEIKDSFDPAFGGFGIQPKFPHPDALSFAIELSKANGDEELKRVAVKTLLEMSSGGMYDQFAGGFFRYSTTRDWSIPHFEKMLEDNSRLLKTCLLAYQCFGDDSFKDIALDVRRFLVDVLYNKQTGTFAGSQDADKEDEYYGRPLAERESMPTPFIDWTVYLDWNALMVSAFVEIDSIIGDKSALNMAIRLYEFLSSRLAPSHYFADGKPGGPVNQLCDVSAMLGAALSLYQATGNSRYLQESRGLADIALTELYSEQAGLFQDIPIADNLLGGLRQEKFEQADNSHFAVHLMQLAELTSISRYRIAAEEVLKALAPGYRQLSYFASAYGRAVANYLAPVVHVVLVGDISSSEMDNLRRASGIAFNLNKTIELRSREDSGDFPPDPEGRPIAYVCVGTSCSPPTKDPAELTNLIEAASKDNADEGPINRTRSLINE
jgi:uncharacterized protein YyaL (SSP411 family)